MCVRACLKNDTHDGGKKKHGGEIVSDQPRISR